MPPRLVFVTFLSAFAHSVSSYSPSTSVRMRNDVPSDGFFNPIILNGSILTSGFPTFPPGLGEPLNAIVSAFSDADVLKDQEIKGGLRNYFLSLSFSAECLGQHLGSDQEADLGDGNGLRNETAVIRYNYGDPAIGACKESVQGGSHFRYWVQDGPKANSGAIFMALSYEKPIADGHDIIFNGYNLARDWLVGNITGSHIPTEKLTNTSTYAGTTQNGGYTYQTEVKYMSGIMQNTSDGINHFLSVGGGVNNITAVDGLVAVLNVKITGRPDKDASAAEHSKMFPGSTELIVALFLPMLGLGFGLL